MDRAKRQKSTTVIISAKNKNHHTKGQGLRSLQEIGGFQELGPTVLERILMWEEVVDMPNKYPHQFHGSAMEVKEQKTLQKSTVNMSTIMPTQMAKDHVRLTKCLPVNAEQNNFQDGIG